MNLSQSLMGVYNRTYLRFVSGTVGSELCGSHHHQCGSLAISDWRYRPVYPKPLPYPSHGPYQTPHQCLWEELMIDNAEKALAQVCNQLKLDIVDYTAAPVFMNGKEKGLTNG